MEKTILGVLIVIFLQGCASRTTHVGHEAYEAVQSRQRAECAKIPQTADYQQCMENTYKSYDSYAQKRNKYWK